jgi:hypothetical protein
VIIKSLLAAGSSVIIVILITFPEGLQAGTIYDCRDKNGSIVLSDTPLGKGYNCKRVLSFDDITDEDRKSWEKERKLSKEKLEKYQKDEEKERIERQEKAVEAVKERKAEEPVRTESTGDQAAQQAARVTEYLNKIRGQ